jgi:hypothetical protein
MSVASWVIAVSLATPAAPPEPQRPASMQPPPPAEAPAPEPTPEPAPAPTETSPASGPDEVVLKNGGFVRGEVVELLPDDRVVIIPDHSNERRTIPWSEVERVDRGKYGATVEPEPTPIPTALPEPAPEAAEPSKGQPRVHLNVDGSKTVRLYEISAEISAGGTYGSMYGIHYRVVCESPCDRVIDGSRGQDFFLGQDTVTASRRFSLTHHTGDLTLNVKPGSKGLRLTGSIFVGLGIGLTIAGIIFTIPQQFRYFGVPMLAGGLGGIAIGTPMMILGRTRFKIAK